MASFSNVGYARVSTLEQKTSQQLVGIKLDRLFEEKASGKGTSNRPVLQEMLASIHKDDHLYVRSMDRLARNLEDLLHLVKAITDKGVTIHFIKENIVFDPSVKESSMLKLLLSVMGAIAEFEHELTLERQREGIALAKARGAYKGRKPVSEDVIAKAKKMVASGMSKTSVAKSLGIGRTSLYKYLSQEVQP